MAYQRKGGQGGPRPCHPGCTCRRHGALRRERAPQIEWEGDVARIFCPQCNRRIAGTFTEEEAEALLAAHRHRMRDVPKVTTQVRMEVA